MSGHSVTWDHSGCDHDQPDPDDNFCAPTGTVICHGDLTAFCHLSCDEYPCAEYGWSACDNCEESIKDAEAAREPGDLTAVTAHPDLPHDTNGHAFYSHDYCNVVEYLPDDIVADTYANLHGSPPDYHDGPITPIWDEGYLWEYAEEAAA